MHLSCWTRVDYIRFDQRHREDRVRRQQDAQLSYPHPLTSDACPSARYTLCLLPNVLSFHISCRYFWPWSPKVCGVCLRYSDGWREVCTHARLPFASEYLCLFLWRGQGKRLLQFKAHSARNATCESPMSSNVSLPRNAATTSNSTNSTSSASPMSAAKHATPPLSAFSFDRPSPSSGSTSMKSSPAR